jgi:Zn2+/Cd2+-exporting ATPase
MTATYKISGMDCLDCATTIEKGVSKLNGVTGTRVDFGTAKLFVEGSADLTEIQRRVEALGYGIDNSDQKSSAVKPDWGVIGFWRYLLSRNETRLALAGGVLVLVGLAAALLGLPDAIKNGLFIAGMFTAGYPPVRSGLNNLFVNHEFNIDLLMVIAAIGALVIGDVLEGATVIFLFAIGESLEGFTADRARDSLRSLMELAPQQAIRITDHGESVVPVEAIQLNDRVLVKAGERIPVDGVVLSGESDVNQATITGESIPVYKSKDSEVFAGTMNGSGTLAVSVTHLAADSTLSRIIHLVEEAQAVRAPSQRAIDRFAKYYTPAVVVGALLIAIVPPLVFQAPFWEIASGKHGWLYRALSLLVIACPCALVISAPVTVISGITSAARRGVLIKGGVHLEALARVKAFAFDKTGTLTEGKPTVMVSRAASCATGVACDECDDVLALASAVEQRSTHPLAKAVVNAAAERGIAGRYAAAENVEALAGQGIRGKVGEHMVTVGSHRLFDAEHPHSEDFHSLVNEMESQGQTAMLLSNGDRVQGVITVADSVRSDSKQTVARLKQLGTSTVMLTGDNAAVAETVGREVGVDEVKSGLLPQDKVDMIYTLHRDLGSVAMVGDGINDTPALAASDIGIAMGGAGSAQALEAADVVLMGDDIKQLPYAVRLARFTRSLIWQNIAFSIATKLFFLGLALFGVTSLWLAILADVGVSILVTLNGMRPLRFAAQAE